MHIARIKLASAIMLRIVSLAALGWLGEFLFRMIRFTFVEPESWNALYIVDNFAVIPLTTKLTYFALWLSPVVPSIVAYLSAILLLNRFRKGQIFNVKSASIVILIGQMAATSMVFETIAGTLNRWVLTWHNAAGAIPPCYWFDSQDIAVFLFGLAFVLVGWVLKIAVTIDGENKEFV